MAPGQRLLPGQADGGRVRHAAIAAQAPLRGARPRARSAAAARCGRRAPKRPGAGAGSTRGANRSPRSRSSPARGGHGFGAGLARRAGGERGRVARPALPAPPDPDPQTARRARRRPRCSAPRGCSPPAGQRRATRGQQHPPPRPKASSRRTHPGRAGSQVGVLQPPSVLLGLVLAAVLCLEIYIAVAGIALSAGQVLLAFAFALDACARALGAIAAGKVDRQDWAWGCVIVGSPVVAGFALFQRSGPVMHRAGAAGRTGVAGGDGARRDRPARLDRGASSAAHVRPSATHPLVTLTGVDPEPGEEVFFHGHPSWRALIGFYVKGILAAVIAGAIAGVITRMSSRTVERRLGDHGRAGRVHRRAARRARSGGSRRPTRSPTGG